MSFFKNLLDGGAGEAQKKNEANVAKNMAMLGTQYAFGEGQLMKGLAGLDQSYAAQKQSLSHYGTQASNQIIEQGTAAQAANKSSMVNKGLFNTSVGANMNAQTQAVTNSSLSTLGENLGLLNANVEQQHGAAKNSAYQSLAQYAMGKVGMQGQLTPQYQASGGGILGGLGQLVGQAAGGPIGGALGSLFGGGGSKFPKTTGGQPAYGPPS